MPPKTTLHCPHVELPELQDSEAREQSLSSKQSAKQAEVYEVVGRLHDFEARLEGYADELLTFATEKQEVGTSGMHGRRLICRGGASAAAAVICTCTAKGTLGGF